MERGLIGWQDGLFRSAGHAFKEHGGGHARGAGFSERSGRVLSTCESGFGEEDLGSGESLEDVHGALAERTPPGKAGSRTMPGLLVATGGAENGRVAAFFSAAVGQPAEIADARETSG